MLCVWIEEDMKEPGFFGERKEQKKRPVVYAGLILLVCLKILPIAGRSLQLSVKRTERKKEYLSKKSEWSKA